ncbi:MAG: GxxExxY protein [Bacteroidetes bacterium]|jgi:GxxExxY protein|nr:GxxExxY protein [Bacteroidota bacterium]
MTENDISFLIRKCIFKVYNSLGPGLLESVYEAAMLYELQKEGLKTKQQMPIPVVYEGIYLDKGFRLDILVEDKVIIEIKSVDFINGVHHKQLITYLKLADIKLGLLVNFNADNINDSIFRKVNKL